MCTVSKAICFFQTPRSEGRLIFRLSDMKRAHDKVLDKNTMENVS